MFPSENSKKVQEVEVKKSGIDTAIEIGVAVAAVVGVGLVAWGLGSLLSSPKEKMMKAPGRDSFIFRKDFEDDPSKYFRDLRKP